ncbi:hypothetical protein ASE03_12475 [Kitasatospora sp. Root187]|nr:hypothetical protein ASC99_20705 [Kitasatospora sp. Root107]KRB60419.1 hypothetical protein ASE03_12475 [Kitasatospora sp. Root187]
MPTFTPPDPPGPPAVTPETVAEWSAVLACIQAERDSLDIVAERLAEEHDQAAREDFDDTEEESADVGSPDEPEELISLTILAFDDDALAAEVATMVPWVDHILLGVYGQEITSGRPWCTSWPEHDEALARIHHCWLAWQELTDARSGATGPSVWQRDHLEALLLKLRAPDGPFGACTTNPDHPHHRLLPHPPFTDPASLPRPGVPRTSV